MTRKQEILDAAVEVLRRGEAFTIDAVAREAQLTKPGVVHHFPTKHALVVAVVDHVVAGWEADLAARAGVDSDPVVRLRAYVERAITGDFDQGDLALLADVRLREALAAQWTERMDPWFGTGIDGTVEQRAALRAARLLADGVWFNSALSIPTLRSDERGAVRELALRLIEQGTSQGSGR